MERPIYSEFYEDGEEKPEARKKLENKTKKELIEIIMTLAEDVEDLMIQRDDLRIQRFVDRNGWF